MRSATDIAWAAGLFDGEGTVFIARSARKDRPAPYYNLRTIVTMVHKPTVERFAEVVGVGRVYGRSAYREGSDRCAWIWTAAQRESQVVLALLLPHLVTKRAEAELALEYCRAARKVRFPKGGTPRSIIDERDGFYTRMKALKRYEWTSRDATAC